MPTIGVYFSEDEYSKIVTHISQKNVKVSDYIHETTMAVVNKMEE
jgi:hypothetical protein